MKALTVDDDGYKFVYVHTSFIEVTSSCDRHPSKRPCSLTFLRPTHQDPAAHTDLRSMKRLVAHLPSNHLLRFSLQGESGWLPSAESQIKLLEWMKYPGWKER